MRWLLRFIIFWAISAPLSYFYGLPALIDYMTNKVRVDGHTQCINHMRDEKLMGSENAPFTQAQGETYCQCVSSTLTFTRNDLSDVVKKIPPVALTAQAEALTAKCNAELQGSAPAGAIVPAPSDTDPIAID